MSSPPIVLTDEFQRALNLLHAGENLFITGKAGTGKSTLVRRFLAEAGRRVLVAAPTGIAALNVGGYTLHRIFSLAPTTTAEEVRSGRYYPARFAGAIAELDTLVIDEASMVRADLFDMIAAALERFGPHRGRPFGGVQIVLVGDLFQLPPVVTEAEADYFRTAYATPYFFSAHGYDGSAFPTVALTRVFRQAGDRRLTAILNSIREGSLISSVRQEVNRRTDRDFEPPPDEFWLTLTTTNRIAGARNRRRLERLGGREFVRRAQSSGELDRFEPPTAETLSYKVGAQVMMLTNDPHDRWVNGTLGKVTGTAGPAHDPVPIVEFTDGSAAPVEPYTWEITRPVAGPSGLSHEVVGTFTQLPLKLAWAITIHKSQGQTVDRLIVDLSGGTFADGQLYVALSRCTSMAGLVLTRPVFPKDLKTDRRILRYLRSAEGGRATGRRYCALAVLTVGEIAPRSRPRPVELAVAFEDGTAVTTLVNPQRDLAEAPRDYAITTPDVLLAPTLDEAWAMLAPLLDGCTPVGVGIDATLSCIDFELKRLGQAVPIPLGVDVPAGSAGPDDRSALAASRALPRAEATLRLRARLDVEDPSAGSFDAEDADDAGDARAGFLLTRDADAPTPDSAHLPQLSAVLAVSRDASSLLLASPGTTVEAAPSPGTEVGEAAGPGTEVGNAATPGTPTGDGVPGTAAGNASPALAEARGVVAAQIRAAAARSPVDRQVMDRLASVGAMLGTDLIDGIAQADARGADAVLAPETRVCFTGEAVRADGSFVPRDEMERLARRRGLTAVANVTKTKCDVLVTAEVTTQSGKARKAREWGKSIVSAADFLAWADGAAP